ncbi:MAG: FAD-binding protein [Bacteroidales bacterium]|nr:FAD-binding protein [Bacteroidales bacterium]
MKEFEIVKKIGAQLPEEEIRTAAAKALGVKADKVVATRVVRRSIDARQDVLYRYRIEAYREGEEMQEYALPEYKDVHDAPEVGIIGAGPAGMFAALKLLQLGLKPVILERGKDVHRRKVDMATLSTTGVVDPDSNYCFGEGGAGAFSDGKLFTRSSKRGDIREVLYQLVRFGASEDILIDAHPHIGTDRLPVVVENIRHCIEEHGGEYHFDSRVTEIRKIPGTSPGMTERGQAGKDGREAEKDGAMAGYEVETSEGKVFRFRKLILATGHSARDIYELFHRNGWAIEPKGFALGVRVEHPQWMINQARYHGKYQPFMPTAEYSFVTQVEGRGVFSFCMCPGGILVPAATTDKSVVLNGMSNSARNSKWANAGVVVQVEPEDVPEEYAQYGVFSVLYFQRDVERKMYMYSRSLVPRDSQGRPLEKVNLLRAPAQRMMDFCRGVVSRDLPKTSYHPGAVSAPLHELLPACVSMRLRHAFPFVGNKLIKGYYTNDALLLGVESRTSSPIRIPRDPETLEHAQLPGLYPCGEGAGYAGGIVSSALDGINCAVKASE